LYKRAHIYFSLAILVAFIGFFPSYFSRLGQTDAIRHFHGLTALAWMLLLLMQAWLIRQGNRPWHRRLGRSAFVLAPLFIASGLLVTHSMLLGANPFQRAFGPQLAFLDLTSVIYFGIVVGLAIRHRRNIQLHARYMASTAVLVLPPAVSRIMGMGIPGISSFEASVHVGYFLTELVVLLLIIDDRRMGRVRLPYPMLMAVLLVQQAGFVLLPHWQPWLDLCKWIGTL
jgi:uncharacterized membrane protein YozB (DUF420 family)